jgi:D-arabinose 1-dehydrogenase-like Zn-dependent alcohol dehydrogenase
MTSDLGPTMRAERFYADTKTVVVEDVPIPEPGTGEVLVKVAFCGICHSDLSLINGTFPAQAPVVTQGHEASGTIAKLGPGVTGWAEVTGSSSRRADPVWNAPTAGAVISPTACESG